MHFMNGVAQIKKWIAEGAIGTPLICHSERTGWEDRQATVSWKKSHFGQTIMGSAESICATGGNLVHQGEGFGDEEDVLLLTLQFSGGALGTMLYGSGYRLGEHFAKINGTEGAVLIDFERSKIIVKSKAGTDS